MKELFERLKPGINELQVWQYNGLVIYINGSMDLKIIDSSPLGYWFVFERNGDKIGVTYSI
jgi:hypothetical protein